MPSLEICSRVPHAVARLKTTPEIFRLIILIGLVLIHTGAPLGMLSLILETMPGVSDHNGFLHLGWVGYFALVSAALITCFLSVGIGAIARIIIPLMANGESAGSFIMGITGFVMGGLAYRSIAETISDITKGDGVFVLMFVALWVATMGYIAKVAWDDLRDRLIRFLDPPNLNYVPVCHEKQSTGTDNEATPPVGGDGL